MAENSNERVERRIWTAGVVDEQTATVRVLGPGQDAATTALAGDLLEIAEQALEDRSLAERIVTTILRNESQLVTTATLAVTPSQREVAKQGLARIVRRAVLDAIPPIVRTPVSPRGAGRASPNSGKARKLRPVQGRPMSGREEPEKDVRAESTPGKRREASPSAPGTDGKRRRGLLVVVALLAIVVAGLALWHIVLRPAGDRARVPPETALVQFPPSTAPLVIEQAEELQLEAVEPASGPFRPQGSANAGSSAASEERLPAASSEVPPESPIETSPVAALDSAPTASGMGLGGIGLPAGADNLRIFILYPEGNEAAAEADDLYAALSGAGEVPLVVLRNVDFTIASPRIRYFYSADAEAGRALADFLDAPDGAWALQDFSHVRPLPAPGTVEIYVPSL